MLSEQMLSREPMKSWDAGDCISSGTVEYWADEVAKLERVARAARAYGSRTTRENAQNLRNALKEAEGLF